MGDHNHGDWCPMVCRWNGKLLTRINLLQRQEHAELSRSFDSHLEHGFMPQDHPNSTIVNSVEAKSAKGIVIHKRHYEYGKSVLNAVVNKWQT